MKNGHGFVLIDENFRRNVNSRDFKRCVKQKQVGIRVEPAAKVDSTFLSGNIPMIPSPLPSWTSAGHSQVQKFWWTCPELQVLPDFYLVLLQEQ